MIVVTGDFEVRSPVDIKKAGPWKYAEHPNTIPLCLALKINNQTPSIWINPKIKRLLPSDLLTDMNVISDSVTLRIINNSIDIFEAQNAEFERAIWRNIMVARYGWPDIPDRKWRCSAAKAAAHALPRSLKGAGVALGLSMKKDMEGHRIMMKLCRPRKATKDEQKNLASGGGIEQGDKGWYFPESDSVVYLWHEDPEDFLKLFRYCLQDVEAEHAISQALDDLNPVEQKVWFLDQKMNERGILADVENAKGIIEALKTYEKQLLQEIPKLTNGAVQTAKQVAKLAEFCGVKDMTKVSVTEALESTEIDPNARRVLEIRRALGKSSVSKFKAILDRAGKDGRLRSNTMYHGASTGRWTAKGVQLQNLPRKSIDEPDFDLAMKLLCELDETWISNCFGFQDPVELAQALIRPMLRSPDGKDFVCADFSQIEARIVFWLAGVSEVLESFRQKKDPYCELASEIYEKPINKHDHPVERQVGKHAILGLGFGMGAKKFIMTCKIQGGIDIEKKFSRKVVKLYRKKYPQVPELWYSTERAAIEAVIGNEKVENGKTSWRVFGRFLQCELPSGRKLSYADPKVQIVPAFVYPCVSEEEPNKIINIMITELTRERANKKARLRAVDEELTIVGPPIEREKSVLTHMAVDSKTKKWTRESTYGGKLVENTVQATARDIMALAMLRAEKRGYKCVLSVHDEIISEAPEGFGSVEEFESIMAEIPTWAEGCPIAAEGWRGKRYRK